ncbi:MAG: hypothetical protein NPINA01_01930 [Nitrospinaceae bacterium]|nr:MAG: hypothetical protein NPINA01_01930 [Nitrospinaceae bacterium]
MFDPVYFSLFEGIPEGPVTIFNEGQWTLDNQVELETCIIGKSHRVTSRGNGVSLTEFIACSSGELTGKSLDHFPLKPGKTYSKEYQVGNIQYGVDIEMVPSLFDDMEGFLRSMGEVPPMKILTHRFEASKISNATKPFTGVAVDPAANRFFTIHTYPENRLSIVSKTCLFTSTGATA